MTWNNQIENNSPVNWFPISMVHLIPGSKQCLDPGRKRAFSKLQGDLKMMVMMLVMMVVMAMMVVLKTSFWFEYTLYSVEIFK